MMIVKRSEIIGREVFDRATGRRMGRATDLFVETVSGRVTGLLYELGDTRGIIPRAEVSVFGPDAILVDSAELVRARPSYDTWVGSRVVTRDGEELGRLEDFYFDSLTGYVGGYVVSGADDGGRSLLYSEYFESWSPGTLSVRDEAASHLEGENEGSVRRLVEGMKSRAVESVSELRDVTRALVNKVKADLSGTAEVTREAFNRAVDRARRAGRDRRLHGRVSGPRGRGRERRVGASPRRAGRLHREAASGGQRGVGRIDRRGARPRRRVGPAVSQGGERLWLKLSHRFRHNQLGRGRDGG
ncbi:MAG TPA: PRC-barrel domain-containing protein [Pyrinomonadaceae bacterium]